MFDSLASYAAYRKRMYAGFENIPPRAAMATLVRRWRRLWLRHTEMSADPEAGEFCLRGDAAPHPARAELFSNAHKLNEDVLAFSGVCRENSRWLGKSSGADF